MCCASVRDDCKSYDRKPSSVTSSSTSSETVVVSTTSSAPFSSAMVRDECAVTRKYSDGVSYPQVVASKNSLLGLDEPPPTRSTRVTKVTRHTSSTTRHHSQTVMSGDVAMAPTRRKAIADAVVKVLTPLYKKGKISSKVSWYIMYTHTHTHTTHTHTTGNFQEVCKEVVSASVSHRQ